MKTVLVEFSGKFEAGDTVTVNHVSPGGGRNTCLLVAGDLDDGESLAQAVAAKINGGTSEFSASNFEAAAMGATLQIMCNDGAGDVSIKSRVEDGSPSGARDLEVIEL